MYSAAQIQTAFPAIRPAPAAEPNPIYAHCDAAVGQRNDDAMYWNVVAKPCDDAVRQRNDGAEHCSDEVVRFDHDAVRCPGEAVLTSCEAVH